MPARVVALSRTRRRPFAILRGAPAWLRAVASSFSKPRPFGADVALSGGGAGNVSLVADCEASIPRLNAVPDAPVCGSCRRCEEACPSDALEWLDVSSPLAALAFEGEDPRLFLDTGACIGCAECVRVCPESWMAMRVNPERVAPGGQSIRRNLVSEFIDCGVRVQ